MSLLFFYPVEAKHETQRFNILYIKVVWLFYYTNVVSFSETKFQARNKFNGVKASMADITIHRNVCAFRGRCNDTSKCVCFPWQMQRYIEMCVLSMADATIHRNVCAFHSRCNIHRNECVFHGICKLVCWALIL